MEYNEIRMSSNSFEDMGKTYDCEYAVKRDIENILHEAENSHKGVVDELYKRETLRPYKARVYFDKDGSPAFGMIIYTIEYKEGTSLRTACGDYYPIYDRKLSPHPYQASICW